MIAYRGERKRPRAEARTAAADSWTAGASRARPWSARARPRPTHCAAPGRDRLDLGTISSAIAAGSSDVPDEFVPADARDVPADARDFGVSTCCRIPPRAQAAPPGAVIATATTTHPTTQLTYVSLPHPFCRGLDVEGRLRDRGCRLVSAEQHRRMAAFLLGCTGRTAPDTELRLAGMAVDLQRRGAAMAGQVRGSRRWPRAAGRVRAGRERARRAVRGSGARGRAGRAGGPVRPSRG